MSPIYLLKDRRKHPDASWLYSKGRIYIADDPSPGFNELLETIQHEVLHKILAPFLYKYSDSVDHKIIYEMLL